MGISDWDDGVPAPRDAEGRLVSLDTEELFADGDERVHVISFLYAREESTWRAFGYFEDTHEYVTVELRELSLTVQDNWESLEEDARKTPRDYTEGRGITVGSDGRVAAMCKDIVSRAKALAGVRNEG